MPEILKALDSGTAALLGAIIGAGSGIVAQIVTAFFTASHETRVFARNIRKESIASVIETYEDAIDAIYKIKDGKSNSLDERARVTSRIRFRGSKSVNGLIDEYFLHKEGFDEKLVIQEMHAHIKQLEKELR